jgi:hypothetical protein
VLNLILILLVVWLVLTGLLAAWTLWFQGYIYSEPAGQIYWRAPAAGTALTAFVCLWVLLDYRSIQDRADEGRYQPLQSFSARETETYKHLWISSQDRKDEHYELRGNRYLNASNREPRSRPLKIVAGNSSDGEKRVFEPEFDAKGNFKVEKDQPLRYYDKDKSRYMDESAIGQITIFHFGWLAMNLLLNFGFLVVWFLSLWLLLRFQWSHALGLAVVFWLVALLMIMPMILKPAETLRKERLPPKTAATAFNRLASTSPARPSMSSW